MSIGNVGSAANVTSPQTARAGEQPARRAFDKLRVGQQVELTVLSRLDNNRFAVSLAGERHVVESTAALVVGARVRAMVDAIGDTLELKYVQASQSPAPDASLEQINKHGEMGRESESQLIAEVEARYGLTLETQSRQRLAQAVSQAADGAAMAKSGLFLAKLEIPMNAAALQALYEAQRAIAVDLGTTSQVVTTNVPMHVRAADALAIQSVTSKRAGSAVHAAPEINDLVAAVINGEQASAAELGALLLEALATPDPSTLMPATGGQSGADDSPRHELARSLLNTQDDSSIAYRYGTLPLLVAGQLVELDLVSFQQRRPNADREGARRLIMTLNTQSFGPVQVEARTFNDRLTITFTGRSVHATQELAHYADEVRGLANRFGWNTDAVRYAIDVEQGGVARHIVEHVLAAGSVDRVL